MKRLKFGKNKRIRANKRFKEIMDNRLCFYDDVLVVFAMKNDQNYSRAGVSVGKRLGNAVERNHLKRLLREAFRQSQDRLPQGYDFILMFNSKLTNEIRCEQIKPSFTSLKQSLEKIKNKLEPQISGSLRSTAF